jgi:hypothetical protein
MENEGAWTQAVREVLNKDRLAKSELLKYLIDNNISITGEEMRELLFGDYQKFVDKFKEK